LLNRLPSGARVLIVRLRSLGDCVLTTPAIHLLKQSRPDLRIGVMVEDRYAAVFRGNPDVAAVLPPRRIAALIWRPELTVNLHGGVRSLWLTLASLARFRAGFGHFRHQRVYNLLIPRAQEILGEERPVHTAEHLASAMFWLGAERREIPGARLFAPQVPAAKPYAVIHPMASSPDKQWPPDRFLEIARSLHQIDPIFIGGPGDDLKKFQEFRTAINRELRDTMALIRGASLFLGNDSGPAHIAAAFGVPLAVLFGPSDPVTWAPWRAHAQILASNGAISDISVEAVQEAISRLGAAA